METTQVIFEHLNVRVNYSRIPYDDLMSRPKGCRVELCRKDNHTLGGNPQNLVSWCRLAKKASESA